MVSPTVLTATSTGAVSRSLPGPKMGPEDKYLGSWLNLRGHWNILLLPNILSILSMVFVLFGVAAFVDTVVLPSSSPVPVNTQMARR